MSLVSYGNGNLCHLKGLHCYYIIMLVIQWCRDRPQQKAWHSLPRLNTSTAQRSGDSQVHTTLYLFVNEHSIMLPMKNGAIKQLLVWRDKKLWSQWSLGTAEGKRKQSAWGKHGLGRRERHRRQSSDGQWHEAVVLLDVSLEDIWAWAKDAFKPRSVQLNALQRATGNHSGSPGTIHQQGNFTWKETVKTITYGSYFLKGSTSEQVIQLFY